MTSIEGAALEQAIQAQAQGRWADAETAYRRAISQMKNPDSATLANFGQVLRRLGKNDEALEMYRRATALPDATGGVWFNLGNALFDRADWTEAESSFERALQLDASLESALLQSARCAVKLAKLMPARERFAAVLRMNPANFSAWLEAGHLCRQHGPESQMLACYRRAVDASPERWLGHASLARGLEQAGKKDDAAIEYLRALRCADAAQGLEVHRLMGLSRLERGELAGAVEALSRALDTDDDAETQIDLADALLRAGDEQSAVALFEQAAKCDRYETLTRLAEVQFRHNHWEQAEALLRRLTQQRPDDWSVHYNLGKLLTESWRMEEGLAELDRAEAVSSKPVPGAKSLRAAAAGKLGKVDDCLALYRELGDEEGIESPLLSSAAMSSLYSDTLSALEVAQLHRKLFAPLAVGARTRFDNDRSPQRRLRIGYLTADLHHQHPVNLFMQPVLQRHDTQGYEITVYFVGSVTDDQTRLARSRVARWRQVGAVNDRRLADMIAEDGIDVLIDLVGHTSYNRHTLFARRAAPVQAAFLGYPASTGIPNMDWYIADSVVAPAGSEALYSEQLARMPHCVFSYSPEEDYPYPRYGDTHAQRTLTFGSFNNIPKLTPRTIALWSRVMKAVPDSRLLLKAPSFMDPAAVRRFAGLFEAAGVDRSRLEFRGPVGLREMMAEYEDVDIALDAAPYNGGTTTCQALWMGVPVVALAGENFCQRMGASILNAIGRPQWVAPSEAGYVEVAKRMASNRIQLLAEKQDLRRRMQQAPAQDIVAYTRDLEALYRDMWTKYCASTV